MHKLRHTCRLTLFIYLALVPLSLLVPSQPELGTVTSASTDDGYDIDGTVIYRRGATVNLPGYRKSLAQGSARFSTQIPGTTYASADVLNGIRSGRIPHGGVQWRIHWDALILGFIPIWLAVGVFIWLGKYETDEKDA